MRDKHLIPPEDWDDWVVVVPGVDRGYVSYTAKTKRSCVAYTKSELDATKRHASRVGAGHYMMCGLDGTETLCYTIGRPEAIYWLEQE